MPENADEVGQKLGTPIASEDVEDLKDPRPKAWQRAEPREPIRALGIGPTSWVLAQRPSMGVMLNP